MLLAGVAGLFVGSFLNVVAYRVPRGLSVAGPRSFCPICLHQLSWWENVPILSWYLLHRRCRVCRQPIPSHYPLVELGTAIGFALVAWGRHGGLDAAGYCALLATMIALSLIEYGRIRAPLAVAAVGTTAGLALLLASAGWNGDWAVITGSAIGAALAFAVLLVLRARDPKCEDARGRGRSALLVAGSWCGGLGLVPTAVGAATWIAAFLLCMEAARWTRDRHGGDARRTVNYAVFDVPLVSALALAMAVSFIAAA